MKHKYIRNIKVNVYAEDSDNENSRTRTSTTLNYQICEYCFGICLYRAEARKILDTKNPAEYRQWLVGKTQEWVNTQSVTLSNELETKLLMEIHSHGFLEA